MAPVPVWVPEYATRSRWTSPHRAPRECLRGEATEHDSERRADARAGEHRGGELGDHRHVDRDAVALFDAELLERVRAAAGHVQQVLVGDGLRVAGLAFPVIGDLCPAAGLHVPVETVLGDVQLTAEEPLRVRSLPLEDLVERLPPEERLRQFRPEPLESRAPWCSWCRPPSHHPRPGLGARVCD